MGVKTGCFLVTWAVLLASGRATSVEDREFIEAKQPSLLPSNEGICIKNVPQCAECLDHRTCQRCQKGFLLLESYWGALCVSSCPDGFTAIQTEENGLVCKNSNGCGRIPQCSQCEEKFADICDRCEDGFLLLQQGTGAEVQCVASCPVGFVKHGTRCRAEMCEDFFCSRCKEGWVLQYKGGTKCLSNCPYGFYRKQDWYSDQSYCEMCRANCKSCQDSYNCDVCEDNFFLLESVFSKCVHSCPVGYLPDNTQSLGKVCKTDKLGCLDERCSQCQEGWYRIRIRKVYHCRMECPSGYFGIEQAGKPKICGRCPYNCQECLNPRECQTCKSGLHKLVRGGRVYCVWHCPKDYLAHESNNNEKTCVKATGDLLGRL
ncbi:proprotein convertase subtilisin/kexin type 5-like [Orbicella faveolata]|uniref:proprotein convertase subtilisin/kexin type 5-like n=1 Tax=Orbicella faveolata TaxID=48498 RepID=UPI0009E4B99C|nr:proprotein convertase subtilisin/kexin type 5-like [Orbicella faveolata]